MATAVTTKPQFHIELVNDKDRLRFLPELAGPAFIAVESYVYQWMRRLCADYSGGYWDFYNLNGKPGFMAPHDEKSFHLHCDGNFFDGEVSAEAAGIIVCIFALGCAFEVNPSLGILVERRERLIDFATTHAEARQILQAID